MFLFGFCAGSHGGLGAEAVDEGLEVGDFALLVLEHRLLAILAGHPFENEVIVVAVVAVQTLAAQFDGAGAERIQEGTIVRDDDEASGVARQVILEPE